MTRPQPWAPGSLPGFTVGVVVLGGVAAAVLTRFVTNPARVFTIVAGVIFVLMAFGPIAGAEDTATTFTLLVMHLAVLVPVLALVIPALRQLPMAPHNATIGGIR